MTYQLSTLSNGLRVASEYLQGMESVAVSLSVAVGARYEAESESGISHLLEHMAFKGTATRTARQIAEEFDNIGGQFNAYTSLEHTVYYAKVLKEHAPIAMDILADILQNSVFDESELAREKEVILQEIAMHHDTPDDLIFDLFDEAAFPNQPMGRSILGTPKHVTAHAREDIAAYMQRHYCPTRMVLSVAGNITHENVVQCAERYFTYEDAGQEMQPAPAAYGGGENRKNRKLEQLHMVAGLKGVGVKHPDYYALQLFAGVLGGGMSSRLFQEIREKRGLAYSVGASVYGYTDTGVLSVYTAAAPEKGNDLPGMLAQEIKRMGDGVQQAELMRAKNQHKAELLMSRENPASVAGWMGRHLLVFGRYIELPEIMMRLDAVQLADMERMAELVCASPLTFAALGPVANVPPYTSVAQALAG